MTLILFSKVGDRLCEGGGKRLDFLEEGQGLNILMKIKGSLEWDLQLDHQASVKNHDGLSKMSAFFYDSVDFTNNLANDELNVVKKIQIKLLRNW